MSDHQQTPRSILLTVHNSGARPYESRPDFIAVRRAAQAGWLRWVAWRSPDRIARSVLAAELFYEFLKEHNVDLYLAQLGGVVDWRTHRVYLRTLSIVSVEELELLVERTRGAIRQRYPAEGRGWPGTRRFGFRRNWATKHLETDPAQWEFVRRIHLGYAEFEDGGNAGMRTLQERLARVGCELSRSQIRRILMDPIYVTGEYCVRVDGVSSRNVPYRFPRICGFHRPSSSGTRS